MLIYVLINYPEESYQRLQQVINSDLMKLEKNKQIVKKLYEEIEKGNSSNNILEQFEDTDTINYLSGIMAYDFEITDINKAIDDLIAIYTKERLVDRRNTISKQLDNAQGLTKEEVAILGKELNEIILKLAKIK